MKSKLLKIDETPRLFSDYLTYSEDIREFFRWNPWDDIGECAEIRLRNYQLRKEVAEILQAQNQEWSAPEPVEEAIRQFARPDTLALVTGQQAGLFGGPLYTVYKIFTIIKMAESLQEKYPQWNFVPVFWMEVDDSDFREINHLHILNANGDLLDLQLPEQPGDYRPVYLRKIPPEIEQIHGQLASICLPNEFREKVLTEIKNIYAPGKSFADAFAEWLLHFFGPFGLIVMNPADVRFKTLLRPLFRRSLEEREMLLQKFRENREKLERKGYHSQIKLDPAQTLLFFIADDQSRCRIDAQDREYLIRHPSSSYPLPHNELLKLLDHSPERFSPNVALRPVVQDMLLPTLAYSGGPAEISYFAQLKPLYLHLKVTEPIFFPRARITLLEKKVQRWMEKFSVTEKIIFEKKNALSEYLIRQRTNPLLEKYFEDAGRKISQTLEQLEAQLSKIDPTLKPAWERSENQIENALMKLKWKAEQARERKMETEIRQIRKLTDHLFPGGKYQERVLNPIHFQVKYGPDFFRGIYETLSLKTKYHQLIYI